MSDLSRYARQIVLPEVGVNGQRLLQDSALLVIGLGGLGCAAAPYLAAAGVGRLLLVDRDRVELSNLQRQVLYTTADLGKPKAEAARDRLQALNPEIDLAAEVLTADADSLPRLLAQVDLVLDCSDNFATRFTINAACVAARRPLLSAAAIRFEAQVALFDAARGGACYACLFAEDGQAQERCEEAGVLGPVVGVAGAEQALLALRYLLGIGEDAGLLRLWDARAMVWRSLRVAGDPHCKVCGRGNA